MGKFDCGVVDWRKEKGEIIGRNNLELVLKRSVVVIVYQANE